MHESLVLLVARNGPRRDALHRCVRTHAPHYRVEQADSYLEAMEQATHLPVSLLILDLELDSVLVSAFKRFLVSVAPQVRLHVFDDANHRLAVTDPPGEGQTETSALDELAAVLRSHTRDAAS